MVEILAHDEKRYKVPVFVVVSDCAYEVLLCAFRDLVEKVHGTGWMCCYTEGFLAHDEDAAFLRSNIESREPNFFAVQKNYRQEPYTCPFPWLVFVDYRGSQQVAEAPNRTEKEQMLFAQILAGINGSRKNFADRVYVNTESNFEYTYDVKNVPSKLGNIETVLFDTPHDFCEKILHDALFSKIEKL